MSYKTICSSIVRARIIQFFQGSEKKVNFNDQSSRRSSSMHEAILLSRQSSIDSSNASKSGGNNKRPESVAQKILRERKHMNLKTRYLTESQAEKHLEHQRNRRRRSSSESIGKPKPPPVPLHIALKQTASKHTSRTDTAYQIQQQAHIEAVKSFRVVYNGFLYLGFYFLSKYPYS